jgi:ADP-ribose pyrophosphatase
MTIQKWKKLNSRYAVHNHWIRLRQDTVELPNGKVMDDFFVLEDPDVGCVFGLTPKREVVLVEQYKHGIADVCIELPAGYFESANGDPLEEARREFQEETGYDAVEYVYLGKMAQSPTRMASYFHIFLALDAYASGTQHLDPSEDITVRLIPLDTVLEMIGDGRIHSATTVACIYRALAHLS